MSKSSIRVRWIIRIVAALLALGLIAGIVIYRLTREAPPEKAAPIQARLELAAGEVVIDEGAGEIPARSGTALRADAKVRTGKGARALIRLPDGSKAFLRDASALQLSSEAVVLSAGEYWLDAPPTEREALVHRAGEVTVTAADAGLSIKRQDDSAVLIYVARGQAIVTGPGGRVEVGSGEQTLVKGKEAPKVEPVAFWNDWTGGMADFAANAALIGEGSGVIYGVDEGAAAGSATQRLQVKSQTIRAIIRDALSETEVDQTFFNPNPRPVEGWYWFTVPERASVTSFAVETNGVLVEGELIERREAAQKYTTAKSSGHAPAILEWIDNRTYRARIYPINASATRRVVLRYIELRPIRGGKLDYIYPMGAGAPTRIGELSLVADLGEAGPKMTIATLADARIEDGGRRVTMRRSGYTPRADFQLEARLPDERPALTVARFETGGEGADYIMARYTPDVDWSKVKQVRGDVVVVVDTSAAGDDAARQLKAATAEAVLRALSDEDRFALVALDVRPKVLHPKEGLAPAKDGEIAQALEALADHASGGATDLAALFDVSLKRVHGSEQPAVVYVGDGVATSGEMTGEQLIERLRRSLSTSRARLFTLAVGPQADHALLRELARAGGGESLRVEDGGETTFQALQLAAALKIPTITDFAIDLGAGLDEPFMSVAGKVSQGSDVILLARTHHEIPEKAKIRGRLGGQPIDREVPIERDKTIVTAFVPRLWAAEQVRRLLGAAAGPEAERGRIAALGIEYGLMTPFTSILALESESAYRRMNIQRHRSKLRGIRLSSLSPRAERDLVTILSGPAALPEQIAFGCAKFSPADEDSRISEEEGELADEKQGGLGSRAKGEEGSMGNPGANNNQAQGYAASAAAEPESAPAEERSSEDPGDDVPQAAGPRKMAAPARPSPQPTTAAVPPAPPQAPAPTLLPKQGDTEGKTAAESDKDDDAAGGKEESKDQGVDKARDKAGAKPDAVRLPPLRQPPAPPVIVLSTCSDLSRRPLLQRVMMWRKRLSTAGNAAELIARHRTAQRACELPDWQAEQTFLALLQQHIDSEGAATAVLGHFADRPEVQQHLAKLILRRAVDTSLVAAVERVLFGSAVSWTKVDIKLSELETPDERIAALREQMALAPGDPNGDIRLVRLLTLAGKSQEALAHGRRLRDKGLMTVRLAREIGDVLARAGLEDEAVRTYSEIVEFDPDNVQSRQLLGDVLLARGWYDDAYRQYKTTTAAAPADPLGWLRLAWAAAGAGRVDEALRLERQVATAQGRPGPSDPRRFARLLSAARLGRLIAEPPKGAATRGSTESMKRKLRELQLFRGPATLVLLTWQDLQSSITLITEVEGTELGLGEITDASVVGLSGALLSSADLGRATLSARLTSLPSGDPIAVWRHDIVWDGKDFTVTVKRHELPAGETKLSL